MTFTAKKMIQTRLDIATKRILHPEQEAFHQTTWCFPISTFFFSCFFFLNLKTEN